MEVTNYKHKITETVKFRDVDLLGVTNNAVYFSYFENTRIKYLKDLKLSYNLKEILEGESFFIIAHNNCDDVLLSTFDDELEIYTRIEFIKNSSFGFRHLVVNKKNNIIIAKGGGVFVHINRKTKKSMPLPQEFFDAVLNYENNVNVIK